MITAIGSRISLLVDDMHFSDSGAPVVDSVSFLPFNPTFLDTVDVTIYTHDARSEIFSVYVDYNNGSGWFGLPATLNGDHYEATIPIHDYGTVVQFQVAVTDTSSQYIYDNNGGLMYSYTVDDDTNPTISIDLPAPLAEVESVVPVNVTFDDTGSGVEYVTFFIDDAPVDTDYLDPYYEWQTDLYDLGLHEIRVEAHDYAGNIGEAAINVTVVDTLAPDINSPSDVVMYETDPGRFIAWNPGDPRPNLFEVYVEDVLTYSGLWNSSSEYINITLDGLTAGVYNYTCVVIDDAMNTRSDTVIVTVHPVVTTTTTTSTVTTITTTETTTTSPHLTSTTESTSTSVTTSIETTSTTSGTITTTTTTTEPTSSTSSTPPPTGDSTMMLILVGAGGVILLVIIVVIVRKRGK
jgi:hypothetical protein